MLDRGLVASLLVFALLGAPPACRSAADDELAPPIVAASADHHVHILGPGLIHDWKSLGVEFSRPDAIYLSPESLFSGGADGKGMKLEKAILVPMAHLYGNEEFRGALKLSVEDEHARVRAENDHVAREAARFPGRAVAFVSVNYLRPYAWDEIRRCRKEHNSPGVKVHLANAGTDLKSDEHLAAIERLVAWAETEGVTVLLHFDPQRRGLETTDVERFIERVLQPHPKAEVIVAHLGGSGGFGAWTQSVLDTFAEWLERERAKGDARAGVFFDLSAVILERESEGVPATTDEEAKAVGPALRRIGLERVVMASDYPVFDPHRTASSVLTRSGLTPEEFQRVQSNRAPVLAR